MKPSGIRRRLLLYLSILFAILAAVLYPAANISAAPVSISGLFNTGVDDDGKKLGDTAPELHYDLSGRASAAFVISDGSRPFGWTPSRGQSAWIGPSNGTGAAGSGQYWYALYFDLSGLDPATASISGAWATDNNSEIYLNGISTGFTRDLFGFEDLLDFEITSGFVAGVNELEFMVNNDGRGPTGLLVVGLTGSAEAVPIPGAVWLLGSGLVAAIGIRSRMRN